MVTRENSPSQCDVERAFLMKGRKKMEKKKFYMTTAIAYTSGKPHIGNTYEIVLADSIARFKRQQGYDVFFQTGTDEHGQKIELKAGEAGITPKEFVDNVASEIKECLTCLIFKFVIKIFSIPNLPIQQKNKSNTIPCFNNS